MVASKIPVVASKAFHNNDFWRSTLCRQYTNLGCYLGNRISC